MKNIHLIPTDKPSRLFIDIDDNKLKITVPIGGEHMMNQHIYITNLEEIKEGDWIKWGDAIYKANKKYTPPFKKIILSTDPKLITDCVQAIDDDFLEWFVKNPNCEEVDVELFPKFSNKLYGIIIPKEEPKQETLEEAGENYAIQFLLEDEQETDSANRKQAFKESAKWQQERMYSEEDMIDFAFDTYCYISALMGVPFNLISENRLNAEEWFKQFKKK